MRRFAAGFHAPVIALITRIIVLLPACYRPVILLSPHVRVVSQATGQQRSFGGLPRRKPPRSSCFLPVSREKMAPRPPSYPCATGMMPALSVQFLAQHFEREPFVLRLHERLANRSVSVHGRLKLGWLARGEIPVGELCLEAVEVLAQPVHALRQQLERALLVEAELALGRSPIRLAGDRPFRLCDRRRDSRPGQAIP